MLEYEVTAVLKNGERYRLDTICELNVSATIEALYTQGYVYAFSENGYITNIIPFENILRLAFAPVDRKENK